MNVQTPYRVHLHRRIVRETPGIRLASLYTHDVADQAWEQSHIEEINPVYFGRGHSVVDQDNPRWVLRDWKKGGEIIRWLKENRAAAVVIGGYNDATRLRLIAWCKSNKVPCFLVADSNIRGDKAAGTRAVAKRLVVSRVVRTVTGVLPCGSLGAAFFERYGARPDAIFFSPYEPDYSLIEQVSPQQIGAALARFGLDPARRRMVTCCRLIEVKRVDMVIDAFQAIADERPDWDLVVIGDGPLAGALKERVAPALRHRVIFTGFLGDQAVISALYKGSHIFVLASAYEPWGIVINESVAAGMALVSSDTVGAAAELVRDGVNGWTFPAGNLPVLIDRLREVSNPAGLDKYRAGSPGVLADWRKHADPVEGLRKALRFAGVKFDEGRAAPAHRPVSSAR
jgi:glycosyltransferase involved in cell wall biosynthesis